MRMSLVDTTRQSATVCAREPYIAARGAMAASGTRRISKPWRRTPWARTWAKRMIRCCDTGRLCSGWWFMLSQVLGYRNVRFYDGSIEEWAEDANAPVVKFSWN